VRDRLWRYVQLGEGKRYADNQAEDMVREKDVMRQFDEWTTAFAAFVAKKRKVEPGPHRAFGSESPGHRFVDLKLKWRALRLGLGRPPAGSSPAQHQDLGLNRDATLSPKKGEGKRLRSGRHE
jgi:hypothetical protein